jgi:predicted adenine nucleotide alpha hydrolase (AANH) superfamily ATPase
MTYSHVRLQKKWLIAKKKGTHPITVTSLRFRTKKQAQKKASILNKQTKGSDVKFLVRKKNWRRKHWWS